MITGQSRDVSNAEVGVAIQQPSGVEVAKPGPARARAPRGVRVPKRDVNDKPFIVIWETTQACPLACLHCRASARPNRDRGELSTDEAIRLMSQIAEFGRPAPLFVITGGDPFQRPDLETIVRRGTELGLPVSVSPSGTPTLTREALHGLHQAGARAISLSLDASSAEQHDGFRGVPGVYDLTTRAWSSANEMGLKVQINTTATRKNVLDLPNIAAQVRDRKALLWSVFFLVPTGRGRALECLDAAETEDVLNALYDLGENIAVKTTEGHHFRRVCLQRAILAKEGADPVKVLGLGPLYKELRQRLDELGLADQPRRPRRPPLQVSAGNGFVFISHLGEVHPSGFLPVSAGNIRQQSLVDIYRSSPLFTGLRDPQLLGGRCGACEFRVVCGGSRARAYATTGDVYAEEPGCSYQPGSFPYPLDLAEGLVTNN